MKCSRMHLSDRRYKPPPKISKSENVMPIIRPCIQSALTELPQRFSSVRSYRSSSPHTTNSDPMSSDGQKTPLIICNLNIAPNVKTLAPKSNIKKNARKLPPFCVQYQNSLNKSNAFQESNLKTMNDFIVQGTLIANHRRRVRQTNHAGHQDSPDIIINCEDDEYVECTDIAMSVFNNINTDLLLSLDCFEMDSFGRLPGDSRTPTPISKPSMNIAPSTSENMIQNQSTSALLAVPAGYRPLSLRASSPNIKSIIRIDLVNRDRTRAEENIKEINYNFNRLKEKRGMRDQKSDKSS